MSLREPNDPVAALAAVLDTLPLLGFIAQHDGTVSYITPPLLALTGLSSAEVLGHGYRDLLHPDDARKAVGAMEEAIAAGGRYRDEFRVRSRGGFRWVLCEAAPIRGDAATRGWFGTVAFIDERKRIEEGLRLLSLTGEAAARSLDYGATLQNFADAFVDGFASYCIIDIRDADHPWERIAAHRDPQLVPLIEGLPQPDEDHPIARALARGESTVTRIDDRWLREIPGAGSREAVVHGMGIRSVIVVPVRRPDGAVIGAITSGLDRTLTTPAEYRREDAAFVEEVGRRAGAAITNARLYEQQRRIAAELQESSLPQALPAVDGLLLDAYYRPGSDEATIGGDWYDAFALDDGRLVLTVGDVRGHGFAAAVTMTKLRQAMQAAAMIDPDPRAMLAVAGRTIRLLEHETQATALAAVLDPRTRSLRYASAGHPAPLVRRAGGAVEALRGGGVMLGIDGRGEDALQEADLPPDATLVLYTDGLIEATRDVVEGERRLREAVAALDAGYVAAPARALVGRVLAGAPADDDIAVIVARLYAAP